MTLRAPTPLPRPTPRGFTLIEILTTLLVLAIGMTATLTVIMGSARLGDHNIDRNNALQLIPEAVEEIRRVHLVTAKMVSDRGTPQSEIGLLLTTNTAQQPCIVESAYQSVLVPSGKTFWNHMRDFCDKSTTGYVGLPVFENVNSIDRPFCTPDKPLCMWPFNFVHNITDKTTGIITYKTDPKFFGGITKEDDQSRAYRIFYSLVRHPGWSTDGDVYAGVYVLTLTVYRDHARDGARLEQVSENVVVYLNDQAVR